MKERRALVVAASLFAAACGASKPAEGPAEAVGISHHDGSAPSAPLSDKAVSFSFDSLDERPISSEAMAGKTTVLTFVTTGSVDAQAQLNFLVAMSGHDGDKVNYVAVALHPRREIPLVDALAHTVKVTFPVGIVDAEKMSSPSAPFGEIVAVPTTVVLDKKGRLVWKRTGLAKADEIRAHMR